MKILHIGKYFPPYAGGMETYLKDLMISQTRQGIESHALVHQSEISCRSTGGNYETEGVTLPLTRAALWLRLMFTPVSPTFPWLLNRLIKQDKPEILHLHMPNVSAFWVLFLPAARKLPWVVHWHSDVVASQYSIALRLFYSLYRPFERALLRRSQAVIATSPPYLKSSEPLRDHHHKCRVVPLGIDDSAYTNCGDIGSASRPDGSRLRVLAAGRLSYYKGFEYLIRAAAEVEQVELHLVGTGDQASVLKALSRELGLQERVIFHGHLSSDALVREYYLCDCLCLPSIERTEAFGMVLLEAMCCGKPTVISDVPGSGMGWVVEQDVTGLKVSPGNSAELAGALQHLHDSRDKITSLGGNGQRKFYRQFHIDQSTAGVTAVYREVLESNGNRNSLTGEP